jgi:hypothetical protein
MWERQLYVIHHWQKLRPVILVVIDKGAQPLIKVLIHDFRLTVSLRVVCRRELQLYPKDFAEGVPERRDELRSLV